MLCCKLPFSFYVFKYHIPRIKDNYIQRWVLEVSKAPTPTRYVYLKNLNLLHCVYGHVGTSDDLKMSPLCVLSLTDSCNQNASNLMKKVVTTEDDVIHAWKKW